MQTDGANTAERDCAERGSGIDNLGERSGGRGASLCASRRRGEDETKGVEGRRNQRNGGKVSGFRCQVSALGAGPVAGIIPEIIEKKREEIIFVYSRRDHVSL